MATSFSAAVHWDALLPSHKAFAFLRRRPSVSTLVNERRGISRRSLSSSSDDDVRLMGAQLHRRDLVAAFRAFSWAS